jgi:lethal(2) giant larvae protein
VTFDLTSKVIDFALVFPLKDEDSEENENNPTALVILAEEELVTIDLRSENWPTFYPQPYLNSIHPSAVTCFHHVDSVSEQVYITLKKIGVPGEHSKNAWPIKGGKLTGENANNSAKKSGSKKGKSLLISGHEDGSVRFWDSSGICLTLIAKFNSSVLFSAHDDLDGPLNDSSNVKDEDDDEWPPFRKVGIFDPYSDDPRLAVKKVGFCSTTGILVLGGTAGQVVVVNSLKRGILSEEPSKLEVSLPKISKHL